VFPHSSPSSGKETFRYSVWKREARRNMYLQQKERLGVPLIYEVPPVVNYTEYITGTSSRNRNLELPVYFLKAKQ
jgi:hypothetical protein